MCFAQGVGSAGGAKDVCVSSPRQLGLGNRCIERILGGSGQLCVLSSGPHPSGVSPDDHLQVQNHHDYTRVARDVLVLGFGEFVHKTLSKTSFVGESVYSTIQQQTTQQSSLLESSCLASRVSHEYSGRFPEEVVNN